MKPRVMSLVIFTCAVGLIDGTKYWIPTKDAIIGIIISVQLVQEQQVRLNMWYESDLDALNELELV